MGDLINGFTGFGKRDPSFVSARDAIRRAEREARESQADPVHIARQARAQSAAFTPRDVSQASMNLWSGSKNGILSYAQDVRPGDDSTISFDPEKLARIQETDRRWAWVEIDLNALRHNVGQLRRQISKGTRLMAVVKADAYGHGAVKCAKTALNSGAEYVGVATVDEGIQLREAMVNAPILLLSQPPESAIPLLLGYKIMPSIYTPDFAIHYAEAADAFAMSAPYHLKVNTGMNRIGVRHDEVVEFLRQVSFHRALDLVGTFTHYATADSDDVMDFQLQTRRFVDALTAMHAAGFDPGIIHAANSAAAIRFHDVQFDMVRSGIAMYGHYPCPETFPLIDLEPVMSVHARVTDAKFVPTGEGVSYGLNYRSPGSVKICTIPIGYADGLVRSLSGRIDFIMGGKRCRQVGNICMDQSMFEVDMRTYGTRKRIDPGIGDDVVVVGTQGDSSVTIEEMCDVLGTIPYELLIGFSHRLPRLYT